MNASAVGRRVRRCREEREREGEGDQLEQTCKLAAENMKQARLPPCRVLRCVEVKG